MRVNMTLIPSLTTLEAVAVDTLNAYDRSQEPQTHQCQNLRLEFVKWTLVIGRWGLRNV